MEIVFPIAPKKAVKPKRPVDIVLRKHMCWLGMTLCAIVVFFVVALGLIASDKRCGEGCTNCWNENNDFFAELFNTNPKCYQC